MSARLIQVGDLISIRGEGRYRVVEIRPSESVYGRNAPKVKGYEIEAFINPNICKIIPQLNLENI